MPYLCSVHYVPGDGREPRAEIVEHGPNLPLGRTEQVEVLKPRQTRAPPTDVCGKNANVVPEGRRDTCEKPPLRAFLAGNPVVSPAGDPWDSQAFPGKSPIDLVRHPGIIRGIGEYIFLFTLIPAN